jgi:hypothetical protein
MLAALVSRTSRKIVAIGAGLEAWLRATERIIFSPEPCHTPDREFIDELVELMSKGK